VINVSRGGVLREPDLIAALDAGGISGAALDVFAEEPLPPESPLWRRPDILCTPHVAASPRSEEVARQILDNLRRVRAGEALLNVVDRARGY
jgi:phosphoglycerate dehydrogenase-like enzyme